MNKDSCRRDTEKKLKWDGHLIGMNNEEKTKLVFDA